MLLDSGLDRVGSDRKMTRQSQHRAGLFSVGCSFRISVRIKVSAKAVFKRPALRRSSRNNAGVSGSAEQDFYSTEAWHRIMAVKATAVFFGLKDAIPAMISNGGGSIVNLSSIAGIIGSEHVHMAYNASKAAVRLMTKSVAVQHAKDKIRANSVHPGVMPPMRTSGRTADAAVRAERMRYIPMRRPGEVDEVAYAILFLASDEASYITGSEIHVDGGAIAI